MIKEGRIAMMSKSPEASAKPLLITRRQAVRAAGAVGACFLSPAAGARPLLRDDKPKASSCILIWLQGGMSHLDSFDPKPDAPSAVRGEFRAIATKVPGIFVSEHLPKLAQTQHLYSIVRGFKPGNATHGVADAEMMSGKIFEPGRVHPSHGSIIARAFGERAGMPPYLQISHHLDQNFSAGRAGSLGKEYDPVETSVLNLRRILDLRSDEIARYGANRLGLGCLAARKMISSGWRFATVTDTGWDHHESIFPQLSQRFLPRLDTALSSLLADLSASGKLETTLVMVLTDFGRASRVNRDGGRDHSAEAGVVLYAGGGLEGGQVIGATDSEGGTPAGPPKSITDIAATIHSRFGVPNEANWGIDGHGNSRIWEPGRGLERDS